MCGPVYAAYPLIRKAMQSANPERPHQDGGASMTSMLLIDAPISSPTSARTGEGNREAERSGEQQDDAPAGDPHAFGTFRGLPEGDVLRTVAHEIRGPLTALVTSTELLQEDFDSMAIEQKREIVSSMRRGALWLHTLVENLLCDATIREGRFQIHRQPVALAEVIEEVRPAVEPLLLRRRQPLRIRSNADVPSVLADPRRIGQVVVNLLSNASKYSPEAAPIELGISRLGSFVRVEVADGGNGIPLESADRLFEPFYRTRAAHQTMAPGAGLGLSIVKFIVEQHGGRVGAANRPTGGALFWFELPIEPTEAEPEDEIGGRR
jgi:K+-sensing histidine kinase KdpD